MGIHSSGLARVTVRAAFAILAVLPFATANAELLRVTAANAVNNSVYDVTSFTPPPGTTSPLNTDGAQHGSFQALVHVTNAATGTVDVLAADAQLGQIIRYTPALGSTPASETLVWSYNGSGPAHPDGLSVDGAGNLYVVTSKNHDGTKGAVWVLPALANSPTGYAASPLLIDTASFTANGLTTLQETAVASTTTAAWGVGDLLVLVGSKTFPLNGNGAELLVYRATTIVSILGGAGPRTAPDAVLISNSQFPASEFPVGMDFWPADALVPHPTLLIATTAGRILRWDFTAKGGRVVPSIAQVFASNLGTGLQKVKVGLQLEVPYAFATQAPTTNTGQILQIGAPGTNFPVAAVTAGVVDPVGIAVARAAAVTAALCATPPLGCDISNGVDPHLITGAPGPAPNISGNVTEQTCLVLSDPRVHNGACDGTELKVSTVCPGFGNEVITGQMCGGSGISGAGFALIRTIANGVDSLPGNPLLVKTQEDVDQILPPLAGAMNPGCQTFTQQPFSPFAVIAWAPREELNPDGSISFPEGTIVETETDPITHQPLTQLVDMTGLCDNSGGFSRGMSIYAVGLTLNPGVLGGQLPAFAQIKATNLSATVAGATIAATTKLTLQNALSQISLSITNGSYACAANQVVALDAVVGNDGNPAANYPGDLTNNANPWGEIRGRLANLYVTLNTLLLGRQTNFEWPLAGADTPPACPPVVTLSANPLSIQPNTASTLTWTSQYATSCTASAVPVTGGWSGSQGLSGTNVTTGNLANSTTFTLTCTGFNNSQTAASATVTVVPPPQITTFAAPASVLSGTSPTLTWSALNATSCAIAATPGSYSVSSLAVSGMITNAPAITTATTYTLSCINSLSVSTSLSVTVNVVQLPVIGSFSVSPTSLLSGTSPVISWTSNAMACAIASTPGSFSASGLSGSGMLTAAPITVPTTYTLACSNASGGVTATATATPVSVTVVQPVKINSFTANPSIVYSGKASTLSWSASTTTANPTSCAITGGGLNLSNLAATGTKSTGPIKFATTFTLTCSNSASKATATTRVTVHDSDGDDDGD